MQDPYLGIQLHGDLAKRIKETGEPVEVIKTLRELVYLLEQNNETLEGFLGIESFRA